MQEDKELVFDAIDTVKGCLALFTGMLATMKFNKERMLESCRHGFTNATDAADYLVNHGVPFRDAHGIVGKLVLYCIDKKIALDDMSLEEYKEISPVFEEWFGGNIDNKVFESAITFWFKDALLMLLKKVLKILKSQQILSRLKAEFQE